METASSLNLFIAFGAGLLSFLSPCVLPLVPSYVTFITGMNLEDLQHTKRNTLIHATLFVAGFTLIFLALGAGAAIAFFQSIDLAAKAFVVNAETIYVTDKTDYENDYKRFEDLRQGHYVEVDVDRKDGRLYADDVEYKANARENKQ